MPRRWRKSAAACAPAPAAMAAPVVLQASATNDSTGSRSPAAESGWLVTRRHLRTTARRLAAAREHRVVRRVGGAVGQRAHQRLDLLGHHAERQSRAGERVRATPGRSGS